MWCMGYGILAWYEGGPMAYRKDEYGYFERQFTTADELLDSFMLGNVPLRKVITEVEKD